MRYLNLLLLSVLVGCGPSLITNIRDQHDTIVPPVISGVVPITSAPDSNWLEGILLDTQNGSADTVRDTLVYIRVDTVKHNIYYKVKPDSIFVTRTDTVSIIQQKIIETPFLSKIGLVAVGWIMGLATSTGIALLTKKRV